MIDETSKLSVIIVTILSLIGISICIYVASLAEVTPVTPPKVQEEFHPSRFKVTFKDGSSSRVNAYTVMYGQLDSYIYFLGINRDTILSLPKIQVEDVIKE